MNISENKRVLAISALFALAFGGICYYGYTRSVAYDETTRKLDEISERFQEYESAEFAPTKETLRNFDEANKKLKQINGDLQKDFHRYANFCYGDGKQISAQDFQNELRGAIAEVKDLAADKKCNVAGAAADLGLRAFINEAPVSKDVPFRRFQLQAVSRVAQGIVGSGAPELSKVYCAPLPDDKERQAAYFPLDFEVAFTAKRGVLPQVMNQIISDRNYFLMVTGVSVLNETPVAAQDPYQKPAQVTTQGDDITADVPEEQVAPPARQIAVRKLGNDDETVRVHLTLQVLYFNPAKSL